MRICAPLLIAASVAVFAPPASLRASESPPSILLIASDDPSQAYVQEIYQGFRDVLDAAPQPTLLFREFFDVVRFGDAPDYDDDFRNWLYSKYRNRPISLLVATQQQTLDLLAQRADSPWNDVPVVYGSLGPLTRDVSETHPTASGIVAEHPLPQLLTLIRQLLPGTRRIAVIHGASRAERLRNVRYVERVRGHGLDVLDLGDQPLASIIETVSTLPADTVPVLVGFQVDAAGRTYQSDWAVKQIVQASSRPVFSVISADIGSGIVGGYFFGARMLGRELAAAALARLDGRAPATVTVPVSRHASAVFDARQLARWHIDEGQLPPGSTVLFRTPSLWRDHRPAVVAVAVFCAVQSALLVMILIQRRHRARVQRELAASNEQLEDLADRLITAQEDERTRIARDLHDDMGQRLASVSIGLSAAKRVDAGAITLRQELSSLQQEVIDISGHLRKLSHDLHPGILAHVGLLETLRARCAEFRAQTGIAAHFDVSVNFPELPDAVALCVYRVVQEALRNVARHAGAHQVMVSLSNPGTHVVVQVADDGRGFEPSARKRGLGLLSLSERVKLLGGTLHVRSTPAGGTTVSVTLPMEVSHAA